MTWILEKLAVLALLLIVVAAIFILVQPMLHTIDLSGLGYQETADEFVIMSVDHAVKRHGDQLTYAIRESCVNNPIWKGKNSEGRKAIITSLFQNGNEIFGVCFFDPGNDYITSYPRKGTLQEIINWLRGGEFIQ